MLEDANIVLDFGNIVFERVPDRLDKAYVVVQGTLKSLHALVLDGNLDRRFGQARYGVLQFRDARRVLALC